MSSRTSFTPPRRVSMEMLARELGVSVATISRALNGKPGISDEVRARVEAALKERAYHRSTPQPRKARSRLHTVAFVVSDDLFEKIHQGDDFYGRHLIAVQKAISDAGFYPLLIGYNQDLDSNGMLRCIAEKRAQAIIGESWSVDLTERIARKVPVVLFNRVAANCCVDTVSTDMHAAAHAELSYLYDLGHRCIALFRLSEPHCGWEDICFWQQYFSFAKKYGLELPAPILEPVVFGTNEHGEAARRYVDRILSSRPRPTAIVTHDSYAGAIIEALAERGIQVPQEMSVVGFNDTKGWMEPKIPLTTYRQNFDALAQEAMRLVLDRAARPEFPARLVRMTGQLIVRDSTAPPLRAPKKR